jgi:hypothetical protein
MFQALIMNEANRSIALARIQKWVAIALLIAPADLALDVALCGIDNSAVNLYGFFREVIATDPVLFLLVPDTLALLERGWTHGFLAINVCLAQLSAVVLDLELDPPQLDYVSLLQTIVLWSRIKTTLGGTYCLRSGAFKVAHNYEHLVIHVLIELLRGLLHGTIRFLVLDRYQSVILYEEFAYKV